MSRADNAMRQAKTNGRDQAVIGDSSAWLLI